MNNAIDIKDLKYRYPMSRGNRLSLAGITLSVRRGETLGVIGANGSGKSTLCQAMCGLVPILHKGAYGGKVLVDGADVAQQPLGQTARKIGIVFQNPYNQLSGCKLTVFEEVAFGPENIGVPRDEMIRRVDAVLERLGLTEFAKRDPFSLSGGQTQRVALAGILVMEPEIVVFDDAASQLDPRGAAEVYKCVRELRGEKTVILAEHKMEAVAELCDRVLLLSGGVQIALDTPKKIFARTDLELFGVRAPLYAKVCEGMVNDRGDLPVTLDEAADLLRRNLCLS